MTDQERKLFCDLWETCTMFVAAFAERNKLHKDDELFALFSRAIRVSENAREYAELEMAKGETRQ